MAKKSANEPSKFAVRDRRFCQEPKGEAAVQEATTDLKPTYVHELEKQIQEREGRIDQLSQAIRGLRDENKAVRERIEREQQQSIALLKSKLLEPLLDVCDNLERC